MAFTEESRRASRRVRDIPLMEEQQQEEQETASEEVMGVVTEIPSSTQNLTDATTTNQTTPSYWADPTHPALVDRDEEFVNAVVSDYEDSNEPGSAMGVAPDAAVLPTTLPPILLELRWLPPRPPTSYDGFNIYIYRDGKEGGSSGLKTIEEEKYGVQLTVWLWTAVSSGNSTETATVDENTHEFFSELTEPGTYRVQVSTLSSSGDCEPRESAADTGFSFYLSTNRPTS